MRKENILHALRVNRSIVRRRISFDIADIDVTLTRISKAITDELDVSVLLKQIIATVHLLLMTDDIEDSRYQKWVSYLQDRFNYIGITDEEDIVLTHIMSGVFEYALDVRRYGVKETTYSFIVDRLSTTLQNCYPKTNMIFDKKWRKLYA